MLTPKTIEDYQRELYQMFAQSGELQYQLKFFRKTISDRSTDLDNLNNKIERLQVEFRNFQAKQPTPAPTTPAEVEPTPDDQSNKNS